MSDDTVAALREQHGNERRERERRHRPERDDRIEKRKRLRVRSQRAEPSTVFQRQRDGRYARQEEHAT